MLIAVYGTLRKGGRLDHYMQGAEPLGTHEIEGFDTYDTGYGYPYVTPGEGKILVEVYDLTPEVVAPMERMERGAGYEMQEVETPFGTAQVFYMTEEGHKREQKWSVKAKIPSGDWFQPVTA